MTEKFYTLTTFWLADKPRKLNCYHDNIVHQGVWKSFEECEKFLQENWFYLWEHWNNSAVIEEWEYGFLESQCIQRMIDRMEGVDKQYQWWYVSDSPNDTVPILQEETPEKMKFNNGKQTWSLGF